MSTQPPLGNGTPPAPAVELVPIFDLLLEDATRLSRDESHISKLLADFERRQKEHPDEHPVQNPLRIFRRDKKGVIVAGGYRFLAGLRALLKDMPCIVLPRELDRAEKLIEQANDNELHMAYTRLERARNVLELRKLRPQLSQGEAGQLLGLLPPETTRLLKVVNYFPADLHPLIGEEEEGCVPVTTAYHLARLMEKTKDEAKVRELTDRVVKGLLSRDDAVKTVGRLLNPDGGNGKKATVKLAFGGVAMTIKGNAVEALRGLHAKLAEVLRKIEREGWGDDFLPGLMR